MTAMVLSIRHETVYRYTAPAVYSIQRLRMTPRPEPLQRTLQWHIEAPGKQQSMADAFGNIDGTVTLTSPHQEVRIVATGMIEIQASLQGRIPEKMLLPVQSFTVPTRLTEPTDTIRSFAQRQLRSVRASSTDLMSLAAAIRHAVDYQPGATGIHSSADDSLRLGLGVCQDHSHLFIACCHAIGVPARYVSGYIYPGEIEHGATHAWVDAWADDGDYAGWVSIDVTHARFQTADYCRLAVGRDFESAAPLKGVRRGGGDEQMSVRVDVGRA